MSRGYIVNRDSNSKELTYVEYEQSIGYDVRPKNNVKKSDSIDVTKVVFVSPTLIEKILNKKIDKEYNNILRLISEILYDDDTGDDTGKMVGVLNRVELFKSIIRKKYSKFMTDEQTTKILNRLNMMGKELKRRIFEIEEERNYENNYNQGKSR